MNKLNDFKVNEKALEHYNAFKNKHKKTKRVIGLSFLLLSIILITTFSLLFKDNIWLWIIFIPMICLFFYFLMVYSNNYSLKSFLRHFNVNQLDVDVYLEKKKHYGILRWWFYPKNVFREQVIVHIFINDTYNHISFEPEHKQRIFKSRMILPILEHVRHLNKDIQYIKKRKNDRTNNTHLLTNNYEVDGYKIEISVDKYNYDLFVSVNGQQLIEYEDIK